MEGTHSTERIEPNTQQPIKKKKKKGVTRVAHAATLQLNPAMEGYSQYEKGNQQPILKQKGVTWVIQATTSQRNPGCTEKRILVQDQDGGNAQHGKERTQHHKHLQKGLSERRGPRAMLHTRKARHSNRSAPCTCGWRHTRAAIVSSM
jgi:hypothetical protein